MAARLEVTLFWYRPYCFCCVDQVALMLTSWHLLEKSREVCIKARSPLVLIAVIGQVTKHTTVKWTFVHDKDLSSTTHSRSTTITDNSRKSNHQLRLEFQSVHWTCKGQAETFCENNNNNNLYSHYSSRRKKSGKETSIEKKTQCSWSKLHWNSG